MGAGSFYFTTINKDKFERHLIKTLVIQLAFVDPYDLESDRFKISVRFKISEHYQ